MFVLRIVRFNCSFQNVNGAEDQWPTNLADYIRHNDEALLKASERLLGTYTDELVPSTSFEEFCDVVGGLIRTPNLINKYYKVK